ncbi:pheromone-processing carboxypeptidase KEX1-like [Helianthus annuus]|uniref:pheromone-processing carboxypeptidase KEX1-like n=1 Tax=Helianthus annuus TaxID=4232 RepID=UPI000B8F873D|nr:pheromone-processing carboxypeptidase KEX1-like [Helianthus annuus]
MLLLEWKKEEEVEEETQSFILIGKASSVPYNIKEIVRQIKVKERRRKAKIARGEIVDDDSDIELFGDEEEDEDDNDDDDKSDKKDDKDDKKNDDDDQGSSGLLIENPNVQQRIEEFLNDEINEQEGDLHHEASTFGKQPDD